MSSNRGADLGLAPDLGRACVGPLGVVQGEAGALAAAELELARGRRSVDGQGHGRGEDQHVGATERGHSTVDRIEQGMDQPVLGPRDVLQGQLDFSIDAGRPSQQKMWRSLPSACPRLPSPMASASVTATVPVGVRKVVSKHHGAVQVAAGHLCGARRPDRPVAGFVTEKATENRWAVEAGEAQPVDRPVPAHQRSAVPIREKRIVGHRGRAHVSSFARVSRDR